MNKLGLEFKVGVFTLGGILATAYLFFALRPDAFQSRKSKQYYTYIENASGIVTKTHVKTNGVSVGKVKSVELGADNTKVTLEVNSDLKIPVGSNLQIKSVGLLGDSHIEINRADDTGEYIGENELIPQSKEGTDLAGLINVAGSIAHDVKKITANLADVLGTSDGRKKVGNIVDNIEALTASARGILEDNRSDVRTMVANFKAVSANLSAILDEENKEKIERIIASFDDAMVDVKSATRNINLISERVERGEGTLGKLVNDDTAMTELEGAIKDIRAVLAPATKLQIEVDSHMEARRDLSAQTYFNVVFRTRPDRYYLVGLTDTENDIVEERVQNQDARCEDDDNNCDSATRTVRKTEKALKFNLQFAKRWGPLALRFGLFETTGGFAADFFLWNDRLRFTTEAWNFRSRNNDIRRVAHIKSYASILFYEHIYLMAGIDDPTKYKDSGIGETREVQPLNYFLGAGLTFNDQDLKALFGAAALTSL